MIGGGARAVALALLLVAAPACDLLRWTHDNPLDGVAEQYVRLVLAVAEHDPDSLDYYDGPPEWRAEAQQAHRSLRDVRRSVDALLDQVAHQSFHSGELEPRRVFLEGQLRSLSARIDLLTGRRFTFDEETRSFFGVDIGQRDRTAFARVRDEIATLLPGGGTLASRYAGFDRRFVIPRDQLPEVMTRAIDGCRAATTPHLALPDGEGVNVSYVHDSPWSAFTRYEGKGRSRVQINADYELTVDRALELACHETYPGHHAIAGVIDRNHRRTELLIQPMFSPQSLLTEGAASFAVELAFPDAERLAFERDVLFPMIGRDPGEAAGYLRICRLVDRLRWLEAGIARQYLDGDLEFLRAAQALEDEALMPNTARLIKFFNQFRTYEVTYVIGRERVGEWVARAGSQPDARWRAYEAWIRGAR